MKSRFSPVIAGRIFAIWWLFFHVWCFGWKILNIHTIDRCYQEEHVEFLPEFFVHILRQQRGLKWKIRDFNTFEVVQYAILRVPNNGFRRMIAQMIRFYWEEQLEFFSEFFAHTVLQKRGWKWEKRDSVHVKMCPKKGFNHPW